MCCPTRNSMNAMKNEDLFTTPESRIIAYFHEMRMAPGCYDSLVLLKFAEWLGRTAKPGVPDDGSAVDGPSAELRGLLDRLSDELGRHVALELAVEGLRRRVDSVESSVKRLEGGARGGE